MLLNAEVILPVKSVAESVRFYREVLGFESDWTYAGGEFGGAAWGKVHCMFRQTAEPHSGSTVYLSVRDVDVLYDRHLATGIVSTPIEAKPWGRREYDVRDRDGHTLVFSGKAVSERPPSASPPPGLSFEDRPPSIKEFDRLRLDVGWNQSLHAEEVVGRTWGGVVAVLDGETVGMVRITMDSEGWFGIWDVVVAAKWQGRRIGETLMNRATDLIRTASPGAIVFLFTFQDAFYAKLGFATGEVMMRRL